MNGAVVEGRTATGHDLVFTASVDGSGNVTLDQIRAVVQPLAGSTAAAYDDSTTLTAANLVTLTVTVTDGDGDTVAATGNIAQSLVFKDDGPSVTANGTLPTLTVDDSTLGINATGSFAGVIVSGGADGAASTTYALNVVAGDSGLVDTATKQHVILSMNGAVVEGRTATGHDLVFTASVDGSGNVTLDQIRAVVQPIAGSTAAAYDDSTTLTAANLVTLTATVTDGDGDTAAATANIGQSLVFKDDGPSITASGTIPTLTVDDSSLATNASGGFAGVFAPSGGADGAASTTYALNVVAGNSGLVDTATHQNVVLSMNGAVVEGRTAGGHACLSGASMISIEHQSATRGTAADARF